MEVFTNNWNSRKYQIGYALSGGFIKGFAIWESCKLFWNMILNRKSSLE